MEVEWRAFEIHPETPPEGRRHPEHGRAARVANYERMRERARAFGMEMVMPEVSPNSRRALEAAEYAREKGAHEPFHRAVFRKLFAEGLDIYRWDVLRAAAREAGVDPDQMQREVEAGTYRVAVDNQSEEARSLRITGVPTFIFDDAYAIVGAQQYSAFEEMMRHLGQHPRA